MDFDVKTENFEKTRLSIVKLAVWLVYNAFLILYNGYRMMWVSKVPNYDAYGASSCGFRPFDPGIIELRKLFFNGAICRNQSGMKD